MELTTIFINIYLAVMVMVVLYTFVLKFKKAAYRAQSKFFGLLDKKFDLGLITDQSDIEMLKSAIEREVGTVYELAPLLEDYLVHLTDKGGQESTGNTLSEHYQIIKEIIAKENEDKPFADITEEERRLLIGIRDAIQHDDKESMSFNLNELSSVISARTKDYERAMNINRWAVPLAVLGIIASFAFGAFSLLK